MPAIPFISEAMFTLGTDELKLIHINNTDKNRLIFAVMLKFFQVRGRFPTKKDTIDPLLLCSLARQLDTSHTLFEFRHLETRSAKRFRSKIREFLGFRAATLSDAKTLLSWLLEQVKKEPYTLSLYREKANEFFLLNKLEPFTPERTDRYIRSAIHQFKKQFFADIAKRLSPDSLKLIHDLLHEDHKPNDSQRERDQYDEVTLRRLKADITGVKLKHVAFEIRKLNFLRSILIPSPIFDGMPRKLLKKYHQRIMAASPSNILEFVPDARAASMACFIYIRSQVLTDDVADLFIKLIHNMKSSAEVHVNKKIISDVKKVNGKFDILCLLAETAVENPKGVIQDKIYPRVGQETLHKLVKELKNKGNRWYQSQVNTKVHSLYSHAHRKALLQLLNAFTRVEINESQNVVERLNGIMGFIFYGKLGEISTNRTKEQALAVSCLHLLQVCMVYINTLIIQELLSDSAWVNKLTPEDKRALTPLIHAHINPYGLFPLDLYKRLVIGTTKETKNERTKTNARQAESEAVS
ncbi:MAG TPA: hypothetical protein DCZ80_03325 [Legionellales bacterium]|nr:hypothetical protein [Legionellales bacterium]